MNSTVPQAICERCAEYLYQCRCPKTPPCAIFFGEKKLIRMIQRIAADPGGELKRRNKILRAMALSFAGIYLFHLWIIEPGKRYRGAMDREATATNELAQARSNQPPQKIHVTTSNEDTVLRGKVEAQSRQIESQSNQIAALGIALGEVRQFVQQAQQGGQGAPQALVKAEEKLATAQRGLKDARQVFKERIPND